jgi:dsDNA-specific endonuclease/ATPase MutS2
VEAVGAIDLALARGVVSRGWRGAPVAISEEVRLVGARHPLLDPAEAVPINLELGSLRAVVISGPNTGGKTVALKTVGLAALLTSPACARRRRQLRCRFSTGAR